MTLEEREKALEKTKVIIQLLKEYGEIKLITDGDCHDFYFMGFYINIRYKMDIDVIVYAWDDTCIYIRKLREFTKEEAEKLFLRLYEYSLRHDRAC